MCGIIAILRKPSSRRPPSSDEVLEGLDAAWTAVGGPASLVDAAARLEQVACALGGTPGVRSLLGHVALAPEVERRMARFAGAVSRLESALDAGELPLDAEHLELVNAALLRIKDAAWSIGHDRLLAARAVGELAGADPGTAAIEAYTSIHVAMSALDRLEVRGRDSAGLHVLVEGHGLDMAAPEVATLVADRADNRLFTSLAVRAPSPSGALAFVYKAAAEIGELGDNSRCLRAAICSDELLRRALLSETARATVLGHTRWASVGIISEANAHPLNHEEEDDADGPYVAATLNGDIDNHAELRSAAGLHIHPEVTTDAKVVPTLVSHRMADGIEPGQAFRSTVGSFDGSVAIAAVTAEDPSRLYLALKGSGQGLYIGMAEDSYVVASEPYGVVEETPRYVRMDGEARGEIVVLSAGSAGTLAGIDRSTYDGTPLPVGADEVTTAEITTRDIDRGGYAHFLLKEISEAPASFRKTLRGKIVGDDGELSVALPAETLPLSVRLRLRSGVFRRVIVIGQGTAAVAGQALSSILAGLLGNSTIVVAAVSAAELSGFGLDDDMSDTLVIAVSQSGTTTDTNRSVDLVRARGAAVLAVVNRRNSDLVEKADGVLYTSDGRDVEMSVASTKAFYAQVAAGYLLALALAEEAGHGDRRRASELLGALRRLPESMDLVLTRRHEIAAAAQLHAPPRRHWAVVGNGHNRVAASELRIKLSELCYKSIACDNTEDKKHIDLSSEPLIVVCAAGLSDANADDVAKEVAIYRAHKAAPILIATDGQDRFSAAVQVLHVPPAHPDLAFLLVTMAGHLFAYEAALAIDAQARPFREARAAIEAAASSYHGIDPLPALAPRLQGPATAFLDGLRAGAYDGHLEASTAVQVASLLRYGLRHTSLEAYEMEFGKLGTPSVVIQDLTDALTRAIEELTRPVDAIKHQAKTVTVGISRSEEALFNVPLVQELLAAGAARDRLGYRALRTLAALDEAVVEVLGYTRYRIEGELGEATALAHVVDKGGLALGMTSRTEADPRLRGTKHRAATEREVTVARGRNDGRTVVIVPETKDTHVVGMTLLHVRFHDRLPPAQAQRVLLGYRDRYDALVDAVTETEPVFDAEVLGEMPLIDLLSAPVHVLADRWRA
ncbi:MAG TPA: SIS domain-containing protein [Acidimicrobiales bacterium]|nr:SIS domain-containing protein [Acidimicrobiales bacterium]